VENKLRNIDLNLLVLFDELMLERSVSRAAKKVFLSQSAMSNALNRLRELLDDPVLVKTDQGMIPTSYALSLEKPLRKSLNDILYSLDNPETFDPLGNGRDFSISCAEYIETLLVPYLVEHFKTYFPKSTIFSDIIFDELLEARLLRKEYDLLIGPQGFIPLTQNLCSMPLIEDTLVAIVRKDNKNIGDTIDIDQISSIPFLHYLTHYATEDLEPCTFMDLWLDQNNCEVDYQHTSSSYLSAAATISRSDLVLTLPGRLAKKLLTFKNLRIVKLPGETVKYQYEMIWHKLYDKDPGILWLKSRFIEISEQLNTESD